MPSFPRFVWPVCLIALFAGCAPEPPPDAPPPNIVLILADDMGIGDPGVYNPDSKIPTPHLDRLAAEGVRFTDAHSPSGVCTPTRYGVLTGRYSWRSPLKQGVLNGYSPALIDTARTTVASLLRSHGYATAGVGKWHLGLGTEQPVDYTKPLRPGPIDYGFDTYFGIPASLDMKPYGYFEDDALVQALTDSTPDVLACCFGAFWRAGPMAPDFRHDEVLPDFTERSVAYIEGRAATAPEQPFFLYVPLAAPHTPWLPTGDFVGSTEAGEYGDFTAQVDASIGAILDALERSGFAENTLVVFTSDNGAIWTQEKIDEFGHRANGRYRGQKADIWEGGHRVPFIARWPARIPAGTVSDELASLTDLMATFAAAAGVSLPGGAGEDSFNLLPAFLGEDLDAPIRTSAVHHSARGLFALRKGPWKLVEGRGSGGFTEPRFLEPGPGEPAGQLYHLADDPAETQNLYLDRPEVVEELTALLDSLRTQGRSRP